MTEDCLDILEDVENLQNICSVYHTNIEKHGEMVLDGTLIWTGPEKKIIWEDVMKLKNKTNLSDAPGNDYSSVSSENGRGEDSLPQIDSPFISPKSL